MLLLEIIGYKTKISVLGIGYLSMRYWSKGSEAPESTKAIATILGCSPKLGGKTLSPKI